MGPLSPELRSGRRERDWHRRRNGRRGQDGTMQIDGRVEKKKETKEKRKTNLRIESRWVNEPVRTLFFHSRTSSLSFSSRFFPRSPFLRIDLRSKPIEVERDETAQGCTRNTRLRRSGHIVSTTTRAHPWLASRLEEVCS